MWRAILLSPGGRADEGTPHPLKQKQQSHAHRYVPQLYRRSFPTSGTTKLFYLDLQPEIIVNNLIIQRNAIVANNARSSTNAVSCPSNTTWRNLGVLKYPRHESQSNLSGCQVAPGCHTSRLSTSAVPGVGLATSCDHSWFGAGCARVRSNVSVFFLSSVQTN
jgi:hypothetical protein